MINPNNGHKIGEIRKLFGAVLLLTGSITLRPRWDIQRIREYRYNEKLRQKLMKQGTLNDAPVIESFAGHLHDGTSRRTDFGLTRPMLDDCFSSTAEFVEVDDSLPVNVFGYPLPHLDFE